MHKRVFVDKKAQKKTFGKNCYTGSVLLITANYFQNILIYFGPVKPINTITSRLP